MGKRGGKGETNSNGGWGLLARVKVEGGKRERGGMR
jgi:hypothetical protein